MVYKRKKKKNKITYYIIPLQIYNKKRKYMIKFKYSNKEYLSQSSLKTLTDFLFSKYSNVRVRDKNEREKILEPLFSVLYRQI